MNIPLGYEIASGSAVSIPLRHLAVIGQTQLSGKTTTLEALVLRSRLRAIAFVTKRAESGFAEFRVIPPYFRERADWQFVESVLEATLRERLKFERSWIMRAAQGAHSLRDVARNVDHALEKARGISLSVYTVLAEYLKLVIPQLDRLPYLRSIDLQPGVNVMDLRGYSTEMQALVIRSVLEWVYEKEERVITIIPEAWEFIPEERGSPVLNAAEELIRKGAAARNFIFIDSQDLANVNKRILKSVGVYILGVQQEINEVKRTLAHMYSARRKPRPDDVKALGLGEFYVAYDQELCRVYVQPAWLWPEAAREVALGERSAQEYARVAKPPVHSSFLDAAEAILKTQNKKQTNHPSGVETQDASPPAKEDPVWKEKYEAEVAQRKLLEQRIQQLEREITQLKKSTLGTQNPGLAKQAEAHQVPPPKTGDNSWAVNLEEIYAFVRTRALSDPQLLAVLAEKPEIEGRLERATISLEGNSLRGRLARLVAEKFFDEPKNGNSAFNELKRRGASVAKPNVYRELDKLAELGFLLKEATGYQAVPEMKVNITEH